ncbi:MAG: Uncharacterized protein LiPW30_348 [Parcubacteria group bacterium LiPW_30]|nr:MAG: Uncharacterized protein LiPW30_348 [Parcubacteria group bacterium LiPW_30]
MSNIPFKFKYDIVSLIYLADINFLTCEKIYLEVVNKNEKHDYYRFLLLSANNSFNEAVSILHTLLCSKKDEEVRIKPALEEVIDIQRGLISKDDPEMFNQFIERIKADYPDPDFSEYDFLGPIGNRGDIMAQFRVIKTTEEGLADFEIIKEKFEKYHFHKIRHQVSAHKNKHLEDPAGASQLILKDDLIEKLGEIVREVKIHSHFWFGYTLDNPNYPVLIALDKLIDKGNKQV